MTAFEIITIIGWLVGLVLTTYLVVAANGWLPRKGE